MGFFAQVQAPVSGIIDELIGDPQLAEPLIYKKFVGQAFSQEEKCNVDTFDEAEVSGVRLRHNFKSAGVASGSVEKGDQYFLFKYSDLPDEISLKDKLVDASGKIYSVTSIDKIFGMATTITVDGS